MAFLSSIFGEMNPKSAVRPFGTALSSRVGAPLFLPIPHPVNVASQLPGTGFAIGPAVDPPPPPPQAPPALWRQASKVLIAKAAIAVLNRIRFTGILPQEVHQMRNKKHKLPFYPKYRHVQRLILTKTRGFGSQRNLAALWTSWVLQCRACRLPLSPFVLRQTRAALALEQRV